MSSLSVAVAPASWFESGSTSERGTDGMAASWNTSSTPASARSRSASTRTSPSTSSICPATSARFSRLPDKKLSSTRTLSPRATSARTIPDPMNPAPPVTRHEAKDDDDDDDEDDEEDKEEDEE